MYKKLIFLGMFTSQTLLAQNVNLNDMSLEELMDVKVTSATGTEKNQREAPAIITVITDDQIKKLGARSLMDVLTTVPGITLGHDVEGHLSVIMRGIWAQEGRILLLVDGLEINERLYGTLQLGNHIPADHIKRIEIIRGPGSAIYGGFAELGVINVTTKTGADLKGAEVSSSYARTDNEFSQNMNSFMFGQEIQKLNFSVKGMFNNSNFSDRNYTDSTGTKANLGDGNSKIDSHYLNFQGSYESLYLNYIKDDYRTENITLYGNLENSTGSGIRKPVPSQFPTDVYEVGFQKNVSDRLNLHLYYQYKMQMAYLQPDARDDVALGKHDRRRIERKVYGVKSKYSLNPNTIISVGGEHSQDQTQILNRLQISGDPDLFADGSNFYSIFNNAVFSQVDMTSSLVNFTAGVRYDAPSVSKSTFVPRLGLTKVMGKSHIKALFAQAFRAPVVQNITTNASIKPEITTTAEVEYGYLIDKNISWNLNLFSTQVQDVIVYSFDGVAFKENYNNYKRIKTFGLETELRYKKDNHDAKFNISSYKVEQLMASPFKTTIDKGSMVGAPRYKFYVDDSISLSENLSFTPSLTYLMDIAGNEWDGVQYGEKRLKNQLIANLFFNRKNLLIKGFEMGLGVNNLLNTNVYYVQPYVPPGDISAGAYPGQSREYVLRVGYSKEF